MYHANTNNQKVEVARLILDKLNIWTRRKTYSPKIKKKFYNNKKFVRRGHTFLNLYEHNYEHYEILKKI